MTAAQPLVAPVSSMHRWIRSGVLISLALVAGPAGAATPDSATELVGLWQATRHFGPKIRGQLTIAREGEHWSAHVAGHTAEVQVRERGMSFALTGHRGSFHGRWVTRDRIDGHWMQPATAFLGYAGFASPVSLVQEKSAPGRFRGEITPLDDEVTIYLVVSRGEDGRARVFLRNPERNIGIFYDIDQLQRDGDNVSLLRNGTALLRGRYDTGTKTLSIVFPDRGGTYDFMRVDDEEASSFRARDRSNGPYRYRPPSHEQDGWSTGTLEEVGIDRAPIEALIQRIVTTPADSVHAPYIHGVLIARHGRLVLEEYFHGFHRERPHDTRSASKSLTTMLIGAAIHDGARLTADSRVYAVMNGGSMPSELDPRKQAMTLGHLMTMSPGLDCDDSDPKSAGNEDTLHEQTREPDWWRYTLALPMVRAPGERAIYCSASTHLAGGVLRRATEESLPSLFHRLIAQPLQLGRYHLNLTPTGEAYMGGGIYWLPRDFMKIGQVYLDDGVWNGRRILSREWVPRSTAPLYPMFESPPRRQYGYAWWIVDLPYQGGTIRMFSAGGNGGQAVMVFRELDLVIAFYGGNYNDRISNLSRDEYVPKYILPAVAPKP